MNKETQQKVGEGSGRQ